MPTPTKLNLRLPPDVRETATLLAEAQGLSLNAYLLRAVMNANAYWGPKLVRQRKDAAMLMKALKVPVAAPAPTMASPGRKADRLPKVGANQPCPCGSGEKYKRCHGKPGLH